MFLQSISLERSPVARKSKLFVSLIFGLVLVSDTAFSRADEAHQAPDDEKKLSRLAEIWQANLTEVTSAHVRYRSLARATSNISTRDVVLKLLEATDFVNRPDDVRLLSKELDLGIPLDRAVWGNGELFVTGTNIRVNNDYEGRRHSEMVFIDAAQILVSQPNNQIDIYARKGPRRHVKSLDDLRIIPRLENQTAATALQRSGDGLVLRIGDNRFVVEEGTGFVQSVIKGPAKSFEEIIQKGRVANPVGIIFPAAVIACRYVHGDLKRIRIDVIQSASFNEPIEDKVFVVSAPAGSTVFDHRQNEDVPGYFTRIEEPVADILAEIDKRLARLQ